MSGQQAENTLYENAVGWGILLIVIAVVVWVFWYYQADDVRDVVRWIRYSEMWLISLVVGDDYQVFFNGQMINFNDSFEGNANLLRNTNNPNTSIYYGVTNYDKAGLTRVHLSLFNALAMQPLKFLFVGISALGAIWCMFWGPHTQYRQKLGLEGLITRQARNFPVISPFAKFNPSTQPPRPPGSPVPAELPLFAEALGPEEWLAYEQIPAPDAHIDEDALAKAFRAQLGGRWKGVKGLAPYKQILLAAFCLKAARKRNQSDDMLGRLSMCWDFKSGLNLGKDKSLLREAKKVLRNKELAGKTLAQANRHAFVTTAMLRALAFAREEGGVMAPAQFVWLRAHDRALWYPLNNLGRQSFHMESLGAMSHYRAEKNDSATNPRSQN